MTYENFARCAHYLDLFEGGDLRGDNKRPELYMFMAKILMKLAADPYNVTLSKLAQEFNCVKEMRDDAKIAQRILSDREYFCPKLDQLMSRLMLPCKR